MLLFNLDLVKIELNYADYLFVLGVNCGHYQWVQHGLQGKDAPTISVRQKIYKRAFGPLPFLSRIWPKSLAASSAQPLWMVSPKPPWP